MTTINSHKMLIIGTDAFSNLSFSLRHCERELLQTFLFFVLLFPRLIMFICLFLLAVSGAVRCGGGSVCV